MSLGSRSMELPLTYSKDIKMKTHDKLKIDLSTGLMIEVVSPYEYGDDIIDIPCLGSFRKPKWNFELEQWEESASQEYIDSLKQPLVEVQPIEDRIEKIEQEQEVIISVLTDIMGV